MDNVQICARAPAQIALARALPALDEWRAENRAEIVRRATALKTVMAKLPNWTVEAQGAYFAYVRHPFPGTASTEVARHLATRAGIVCIPVISSGSPRVNSLRFAFANANVDTILALEARLKTFTL